MAGLGLVSSFLIGFCIVAKHFYVAGIAAALTIISKHFYAAGIVPALTSLSRHFYAAGIVAALTTILAYFALRRPLFGQNRVGSRSTYRGAASAFQTQAPINAYFAISTVNAIFLLYNPNKYFAFLGSLWFAGQAPFRLLIILTGIIFIPGTIWATVILLLIAFLAVLLILPVAMVIQQPSGYSAILALGGLSLFWIVLHKFSGNLRSILDAILLSLFTGRRWRQHEPIPTKEISTMKENNTINDQDIDIQNFMQRTSRDLNMDPLPESFEQYQGWFQEAIRRARMREYLKTQEQRSALLEKLTAMYTELLKLRRVQGELDRMSKENVVRGLELEEREAELKFKIARYKQAMTDLTDPNRKRRKTPRSIIVDDDEDED